jgi:uncharacterized protein (TIGR03435 family)
VHSHRRPSTYRCLSRVFRESKERMTKARCMRKLWLPAMALLMICVVSAAAQTALPVYDVVTIKPNNTLSGSMRWDGDPGIIRATNITLKMLLEDAFDVRQDLISGLPSWAQSVHYDVIAKASDVDPVVLKALTRKQNRQMLQQLLKERFNLQTHIEVKTLPVFDMEIAGGGIRFKLFTPKDEQDTGGDMSMNGQNHNMTMTGRGVEMPDVAYSLSRTVQRTVIDKTGLKGKYDMQLKWLRDDAPAGGDDAAPLIFTALQEQLGLKLVSSKGPVDTLVIDSISLPTEN